MTSMSEAWGMRELSHSNYPHDLDLDYYSYILPDYPDILWEDELMKANGVADAEKWMRGELEEPLYPEDADYMIGWRKGIENFQIQEEIFGDLLAK